jgi:hypothetical protein
MTVIFKDLAIGDTFDFVSPDRMMNSFYRPCRKISARGYIDDARVRHTVGSVGASVYHVNELPAGHPLVSA